MKGLSGIFLRKLLTGSSTARSCPAARVYRRRPCGLRCLIPVGRSGVILSQLNPPAHLCPCLRFDGCLAAGQARVGVRMGRYSFPVRLFHSLLHAGFDRRTPKPNYHRSVKRHFGLANYRTVEKIATARSPVTGTERGVSNREGDTRYLCFTTLCRNRL